MQLKLKFNFVLKHLTFAVLILVVFYGITMYTYGGFVLEPVSATFFLLPVLITIVLFIEYLKNENKISEIVITSEYLEIKDKNGSTRLYKKDNIVELTLFAGVSYFQKTAFAREFRWLPFEIFHFAELQIKDSCPIYITSLMDIRLFYKLRKLPLFEGKIKYKKTRIASIWWNTIAD